MPASAATLTRCLNLTDARACPAVLAVATRQQAQEHADRAAGLRPYRAYNVVTMFWILGCVLAATDTTITLRYLRTDRATATATLPRPSNVVIPADARITTTVTVPLTGDLAARHINQRVSMFDRVGDPVDATVVAVDGDYVVVRRHDKGDRLSMRHMASTSIEVEVPARHTIGYSQGRVPVRGTEYVAPDGSLRVHESMLFTAWCSCGEFRHHDSHPDSRRYAVKHHLQAAEAALQSTSSRR